MIALRTVTGKVRETLSAAIQIGNAQLLLFVADAGDDSSLTSQFQKLMKQFINIRLIVFCAVFCTG